MEKILTEEEIRQEYHSKIKPHLTESMKKMIEFLRFIEDFISSPEMFKKLLKDTATNPYSESWMVESLEAFEEVLANPPQGENILFYVVGNDANQGVENEQEAIEFLRDTVNEIKKALINKAPTLIN
jgi:hypothetical protein